MKQIMMEKKSEKWLLYQKVALGLLLFVVLFSLPTVCRSHSHNDEVPSFKYSREANENFQPIKSDGHIHSHDDHDHHHEHHDHDHHEHHNHDHEHHNHDHEHHNHDHKHHNHDHDHFSNTYKKQPIDMAQVWLYSMGSTLLISAAPFLLLFVIPLDNSDAMRPRLKVLLAFASGGLLGDAFLHLIPHATNPHHSHDHSHEHSHDHSHKNEHSHNHDHSHDITIGLWVLGGIIAFLTVEKLVRLLKGGSGHSHGHSNTPAKQQKPKGDGDKKKIEKTNKTAKSKKDDVDEVEISGYLNLAADFAHNFTDGLAIGASFLAGNSVGLITTITILLHEVPHEIGDFAILIKSGCSRRKAMMLQLVTAIGALTGNALALIGVGTDADAAPWVLPFTAGGFIYIATVSVLPELLEESTKLVQSIKEIAALLTGVALMVFIANFE